jgi:arginyl-tRNA synthetase
MVKGMSTRKGEVVFLEDILDKTKKKMLRVMQQNADKYAEVGNPELTADILGLSAVFVQDMAAGSIKDYEFKWDRVLTYEGHTGPYLQFAYARLCGIERKCGVTLNPEANLDLLVEKEVLDLVVQISQFPDVVLKAADELAPSILVAYLFELSHAISACHNVLWVKGVEKDLAEARLLLYWVARQTLANGMKIIGLVPLERM